MRRLFILGMTLALGLLAGPLRLALAQVNSLPGYRPASPTLSPWFKLYQRNTGPLDNYHTWVRPELRLRETLQNQSNNIQSLQQYVTQPQPFADNNPLPTGIGAGFMNYSHYYQSGSSTSRPPVNWNRRPLKPSAPVSLSPIGPRSF